MGAIDTLIENFKVFKDTTKEYPICWHIICKIILTIALLVVICLIMWYVIRFIVILLFKIYVCLIALIVYLAPQLMVFGIMTTCILCISALWSKILAVY